LKGLAVGGVLSFWLRIYFALRLASVCRGLGSEVGCVPDRAVTHAVGVHDLGCGPICGERDPAGGALTDPVCGVGGKPVLKWSGPKVRLDRT